MAEQPAPGGSGQVVVLTGAAGGIGQALAARFSAAGARLALLDLDADRVNDLAAELTRSGAQALGLACDVTSAEACDRAIEAVRAQLGGVDVLINNAGITHLSRVAETDARVIERVMQVNFFGALHMTRAALPSLRERRGQIVVMSSVAGFAPLAGRAGYSASKHALHGLFESLRAEEAPHGVGVTMVCPSFVRTGIGDSALGANLDRPPAPRTEVGVPMEPQQLAEQVHRAVRQRKRLIVPGRVGKLSYALTRIWPARYEKMMASRVLEP